MNNYRKTIKRLTEKQIKNEGIINNHILQLGRQLAKTELSTLDNTPLKDTYLEINRLSTHSEENRKKIDQVDNLEREINVLNSESVQNNKIINVKKKEVKTHYEELGFAAYTSFNENTQKDSAYEGLFVDVEKFEGKLTLIEKKINKITNLGTSKTLLNKMANRSKLIYLQTLLKTKHLNQSRLYSNLGEKVFKSDFLSVIGDTSLINNMKPILEAQELVETLVKKDESIFSKKNKLLDEIERLDGNGGAGSSTKKMETEFESTERQLEGLYSTLGQVYIEESLENKITSKEIEKIFLNIQSLKKENSNSDKQILKLEAAINIDQVEKDINEIDNRILRMNREIQEKQDEINTLTQRNGELEIDKKKQMKIRGSKSSLELEFTNNKGE